VTRERNRAPDPVCLPVCESGDGTGPGGTAIRGSGCSAGLRGRPALSLGALAAILLALAWRRR